MTQSRYVRGPAVRPQGLASGLDRTSKRPADGQSKRLGAKLEEGTRNRRLLALNEAIASGERDYTPF